MKTLANIKIGNISALTALKALTVCFFGTYLFSVFTFGFFSLLSYFFFICATILFLICTKKPLTEREQKEKIINKRLKELNRYKGMFNSTQLQKMPFKIILFILLINFSASAQTNFPAKIPTDNNKIEKDTTINNIKYNIYKGARGGRYYYKLSTKKNIFTKRYISKKNK